MGKTVSANEAAAEIGCPVSTLYDAVARGEIPALRIGRRICIRRRTLERLLADPGQVVASVPKPPVGKRRAG